MRRLLLLSFIGYLAFSLSSCKKDEEGPAHDSMIGEWVHIANEASISTPNPAMTEYLRSLAEAYEYFSPWPIGGDMRISEDGYIYTGPIRALYSRYDNKLDFAAYQSPEWSGLMTEQEWFNMTKTSYEISVNNHILILQYNRVFIDTLDQITDKEEEFGPWPWQIDQSKIVVTYRRK